MFAKLALGKYLSSLGINLVTKYSECLNSEPVQILDTPFASSCKTLRVPSDQKPYANMLHRFVA